MQPAFLLDVGSSEGFMIKVETPNHPSLDPLAENFGWVDGGKSEPPWSMHYKMLNICSLQNAFLASSRGHFIEAIWGHFLLQNALLECFFCNHRKAFYRWKRCSLRYLTSQLVSHVSGGLQGGLGSSMKLVKLFIKWHWSFLILSF